MEDDFYEVNNCLYLGEMTFFPGCGFERFDPPIWDETIGDMISLPRKTFKVSL